MSRRGQNLHIRPQLLKPSPKFSWVWYGKKKKEKVDKLNLRKQLKADQAKAEKRCPSSKPKRLNAHKNSQKIHKFD